VQKNHKWLSFRCTGCGNCCKEPLLPLTDFDVKRIAARTGDAPKDFVTWVDRQGIDMDDEPEGFVILKQGKRVMTLRHERGGCRYLDEEDRCSIYTSRPVGCRIFPFDPTFGKKDGKLRRLTLIQAADCKYELDGKNSVPEIKKLSEQHEETTHAYQDRIAEWNSVQTKRKRSGKSAQTAREFFAFLGV
jgi:Fe-S-cluster containining protein